MVCAQSKSKNHKAMAVLDDALSVMKGLDVSSGMFRTNILLRMCTANSELKRHDEALMACDQCVKQRSVCKRTHSPLYMGVWMARPNHQSVATDPCHLRMIVRG